LSVRIEKRTFLTLSPLAFLASWRFHPEQTHEWEGTRPPTSIELSPEVGGVDHHGTADMELAIRNLDDLEKAKPLI
jgi:hypothetical protein